MAQRRTVTQIRAVLQAVDRDRANGLAVGDSCRRHGIAEPSYYRWRQRVAGDSDDAVRQVRALTVEVERLKQLLAETMLDNRMLREVSKKKW